LPPLKFLNLRPKATAEIATRYRFTGLASEAFRRLVNIEQIGLIHPDIISASRTFISDGFIRSWVMNHGYLPVVFACCFFAPMKS
jgi:hypothetical protein